MSTITDSLKNFYKKLGGSLSNLGPNSTSADIVDAMAEVYTDKEGTYVEVTEAVTKGTKIATIKTNNVDHDIYAPVELPTVTSADEGKVLSVDSNGDWVADDVPSDVLIIEAKIEANNTLVFEKTISVLFSEITTAINSGKYVIIKAYKEMGPQYVRAMTQFYTLNAITLSNIYFIFMNRGTNSTTYSFFDIPKSASGTTIQFTDVTVNDPA